MTAPAPVDHHRVLVPRGITPLPSCRATAIRRERTGAAPTDDTTSTDERKHDGRTPPTQQRPRHQRRQSQPPRPRSSRDAEHTRGPTQRRRPHHPPVAFSHPCPAHSVVCPHSTRKRGTHPTLTSVPLGLLQRAEQHRPGVVQPHAPLQIEQPPQPPIGVRAGRGANEPVRFLTALPPPHPRAHGPQIKLGIVREVLDLLDRPPFGSPTGITPDGDAEHVDRIPDRLARKDSARGANLRVLLLLSVQYFPAHLLEQGADLSPVLGRPCESCLHPDGEQRSSVPLPLVCLHDPLPSTGVDLPCRSRTSTLICGSDAGPACLA
ncbi:hypothetical protein SNL152K_4760 [Streptomyces sp. NL15-2K]|nr:hypothetical protein SNL152K_4760 [Streptomyces sp. NL15-2K]